MKNKQGDLKQDFDSDRGMNRKDLSFFSSVLLSASMLVGWCQAEVAGLLLFAWFSSSKWQSIVWSPLFIPFIYLFLSYWEAISFYKCQCDCGQTVNTKLLMKLLMELHMFSASFLVRKTLLLLVLCLQIWIVLWRANMQHNSCKFLTDHCCLCHTYRMTMCIFCITQNEGKLTPAFMLLWVDTMPGQYNYRSHYNYIHYSVSRSISCNNTKKIALSLTSVYKS